MSLLNQIRCSMEVASINNNRVMPDKGCPQTADSRTRKNSNAGFTLLELVIVMTVIVILAAIGVVNYQKIQLHARETVLKQNLQAMRKAIDQYTADKEELPQSLENLVEMGYIREIPTDPITADKDWKTDVEEDTISRQGGQGVVDVHSAADGTGTDGEAYSDY
jgi:general secretion pathway protein G